MKPNIKLIIGLGNPDNKYDNTYHNVGHMAADYLSKKLKNVKVLKTDVYMNLSGSFVSQAMRKTGTEPENLLIIHDDSDLPVGEYKLHFERGSAGHRGVEDIIKALKTKKFWRLRVGIRPPNEKIRQKAEKFVLKKISAKDKKTFTELFEAFHGEL